MYEFVSVLCELVHCQLMVGIPVLEVECTYLGFVRVSFQVVGCVEWEKSGQGIAKGLLQLHERFWVAIPRSSA